MIEARQNYPINSFWNNSSLFSGPGVLPTVIEQSGQGDRAFDIYSRLLRERFIFLGSDVNDQSRVSDASEAIKMGASKLVIGRAITQSNDPAYMFKSFCDKVII